MYILNVVPYAKLMQASGGDSSRAPGILDFLASLPYYGAQSICGPPAGGFSVHPL